MLCPEGDANNVNTKNINPEQQICKRTDIKDGEITSNMEINYFANFKTWKKSISKIFRNPSSRSNDGDKLSSISNDNVIPDMAPEQKWQSLGKMFRRPSMRDWNKSSEECGETSTQNKRMSVKKVISSYFNKNTKEKPSKD